MPISDNWTFNLISTVDYAPTMKANYDATNWKVVPFDASTSTSVSFKMGVIGFDLTAVQEACKTTETLFCAAFERTDGWAIAFTATVPAVVEVAGMPPSPPNIPGIDAVVAYHYGVWFAYTGYAFMIDTQRGSSTDTTIDYPPSYYPFTATPTATTPNDSAVTTAEENEMTDCEYGLCPGFFETGDYDVITAANTQTFYVFNLQSGFENDGSFFEVGDTLELWSIDTATNKNTNTKDFELAGASSFVVSLGAAALAAIALM